MITTRYFQYVAMFPPSAGFFQPVMEPAGQGLMRAQVGITMGSDRLATKLICSIAVFTSASMPSSVPNWIMFLAPSSSWVGTTRRMRRRPG